MDDSEGACCDCDWCGDHALTLPMPLLIWLNVGECAVGGRVEGKETDTESLQES